MKRECKVCGKEVTAKDKRIVHCSKKCGSVSSGNKLRTGKDPEKIRISNRNRKNRQRRKLKQKAVDYLGGKCLLCGYNKNIKALEFHHKDPKHKDFSISEASNKGMGWEKVKKELSKCDLVCANCHREIHDEF